MIRNTQKAIKYYELAIENAQRVLDFSIKQDEKYQDFYEKHSKDGYSVIFHSHTQEFNFYRYDKDVKEDYFRIKDGEIIYNKENTFFGEVQVAEELLSIVSKFYEE